MGKQSNYRGLFWGLFIFTLLMFALGGRYFRTGLHPFIMLLGAMVCGTLMYLITYKVALILKKLIDKRPSKILANILAMISSMVLLSSTFLGLPSAIFNVIVLLGGLSFASLGFGLQHLVTRYGMKKRGWSFVVLGLVGIVALNLWFWQKGEDRQEKWAELSSLTEELKINDLSVIDASLPGKYDFEYFTYGSQNSKRRDIFNEGVRLVTPTVDASKLLTEWKGKKKKWRERYWGFGVDSFPINGHVWMPKIDDLSKRPLPLVMIVHGNHGMEHYSDPGYAYLGELLASRGFIAVSIDENFINGTWSGDFRGKEMPTRAWLLLKHLEQWRRWNETNTELKGKVDLSNIVLIGHSRGGEAVAIAKAYNSLDYFPDDARETFDFNFGIKGLVTIAPTDKRYFRRMALEDVNYLTLQGSYDSDESSFFGRRIGDRTTYSDSLKYINAGIMLHGANHGQFNSIWGRMDMGPPFGWLLNNNALMPAEAQRKAAQLYIAGFAELVLHENENYRRLFNQEDVAKSILQNNQLIHYYTENGAVDIANFEEDIDVSTTISGHIRTQNLALWREEVLQYRDKDWQENKAVVIGWRDTLELTNEENKASYVLIFSKPIEIDAKSQLRFDISPGKIEWLPKEGSKKEDDAGKKKKEKDDKIDMSIDFTIELIDTSEITYTTTLSKVKNLAPALEIHYFRHKKLNSRLGDVWEPTLESCHIPMSTFGIQGNEAVQIKEMRFVFDQTKLGVIILDNIGILEN